MSRGFHRDAVINSAFKGMKLASKRWSDMHGSFANQAPEYWFTVMVAQEITKGLGQISGKFRVGLEESVRELRKTSNPGKRGRPKKSTRENGRADVAVARANKKPAILIEVKSPVYSYHKIAGDIDRICDLIRDKKNTLSAGCMAIYSDYHDEGSRKGAEATIKGLFDLFEEKARNRCEKDGLKLKGSNRYSDTGINGKDWWGVQCLVITRS